MRNTGNMGDKEVGGSILTSNKNLTQIQRSMCICGMMMTFLYLLIYLFQCKLPESCHFTNNYIMNYFYCYFTYEIPLLQKFRSLLKNNSSQPIQAQLRKLDNYLKEQHERSDSAEPVFMNGSRLTLADCYLLPRLQHLKVAGKVSYKQWTIL